MRARRRGHDPARRRCGRSVPAVRGRRRRSRAHSLWRSRLSSGGGHGRRLAPKGVRFLIEPTVGRTRTQLSRRELKPIERCVTVLGNRPGRRRSDASLLRRPSPWRRRPGRIPASCGAYDRADEASDEDPPGGATEADVTTDQAVVAALRSQRIELPSWAFGNSGTRFKVFAQKGVPRDPYEKIADAAEVHRFTGVAPTVALHIPWDRVDDYADLARHAADRGVALGTINSNTFQDDDYMLGSVCSPDARVRRKALDHLLACVDIMDATGSRDLKLWFADGTNYPGQDDIRARQDRLAEALAQVYARLGSGQRLVLEYELFEPAFYTMDVPDWGTSYIQCVAAGR